MWRESRNARLKRQGREAGFHQDASRPRWECRF